MRASFHRLQTIKTTKNRISLNKLKAGLHLINNPKLNKNKVRYKLRISHSLNKSKKIKIYQIYKVKILLKVKILWINSNKNETSSVNFHISKKAWRTNLKSKWSNSSNNNQKSPITRFSNNRFKKRSKQKRMKEVWQIKYTRN